MQPSANHRNEDARILPVPSGSVFWSSSAFVFRPSSFLPILPKAPMPADNTDAVFLFIIKEIVLIDERYVSAARNAEHDVRLLRG